MTGQKPMIERAFALARTGAFATATEVKMALRREGYAGLEPTFDGAGFRAELRALIKAAVAPPSSLS